MENAKIYHIILLQTFILATTAVSISSVDDVPVEYFQLEEYRDGNIDHEIRERPSRTASSFPHLSLKEHFFRSFNDELYPDSEIFDVDIPRPGGFVASNKFPESESRNRRQVPKDEIVTESIKISSGIEEELKTPDEFKTLRITTEPIPPTTEILSENKPPNTNLFSVDDFLRFKREAVPIVENERDNVEEEFSNNENRPKRDSKTLKKSTKLSLDKENSDGNNNRELRDSTRQEWTKFPYQVQRDSKINDHSFPSNDYFKAPDVHFVTQRRSESLEEPIIYRNERKGRNYAEMPREARGYSREESPGPRFSRRFEATVPYPSYRYDPRSRDFRDGYGGRDFDTVRPYAPMPSTIYPENKRKRIIYYANLPEISRHSPSSYYGNRYRLRDVPDERYFNDPYQRKPYYGKPKARDSDIREPPYPVKVSTDVDVREVKKNPERRFYSDVNSKNDYSALSFNYNDNNPTRN